MGPVGQLFDCDIEITMFLAQKQQSFFNRDLIDFVHF
jgi:hypothetical protein